MIRKYLQILKFYPFIIINKTPVKRKTSTVRLKIDSSHSSMPQNQMFVQRLLKNNKSLNLDRRTLQYGAAGWCQCDQDGWCCTALLSPFSILRWSGRPECWSGTAGRSGETDSLCTSTEESHGCFSKLLPLIQEGNCVTSFPWLISAAYDVVIMFITESLNTLTRRVIHWKAETLHFTWLF